MILLRKRKSGVDNLFVSTSEEILIALLDDELSCGELAERVVITEQHLSRFCQGLRTLSSFTTSIRRCRE
jgi:plasmid maintenance system antidote protein VapI